VNFFAHWIGIREERQAKVDEEFKDAGRFKLGSLLGKNHPEFAGTREMIASVREVLSNADEFFAPAEAVQIVRINSDALEFTSAFGDDAANKTVYVECVGWAKNRTRAVVILPHWNAQEDAYGALTKALAFCGFAVFKMTLPYHGRRADEGERRVANLFLNADLGATICSVRQAVSDARSLIGILKDKGFKEVNLIGMSLGSCVGGLVAAVDGRVARAALLLTAGDFAETVWCGRATAHIRKVLEANIKLQELRQIWSIISPINFIARYSANHSRLLIISGKFDQVVPFDQATRFVTALRDASVPVEWRVLPCGHFTLADLPFSVISLLKIVLFLRS
jgi:pimeloyl-ACP methyl ester carboxylesterase